MDFDVVVVGHAGIHFRMLNTRKGPAVQAPRAQYDKQCYQEYMVHRCPSLAGGGDPAFLGSFAG